MRVLLITFSEVVNFALTQVFNPDLKYSAIVVEDTDLAKKNLENLPQLHEKIYPFYELKECIENTYYDAVLFTCENSAVWLSIIEQIREYGVPANKFVNMNFSPSTKDKHFLLERNLRYYKEHAAEFEMFATGGCYIALGLDNTKFRRKLFNIGKGSQDFYFDYQIAKFIFEQNKRAGGKLKYALVGLAPFIFHYDTSKTSFICSMLQYYVALHDLHNFWMPIEQFKNLFSEEFLNTRLPLDNVDLNNIFYQKDTSLRFMNFVARVNMRKRIDVWDKVRTYPETVKENVQILDDYLTLCEENNVRPIMILTPLTPAYRQYFNRKKLDEFYFLLDDIQKNHPDAVLFDGWNLEGFTDDYFTDADHMNLDYAAKFSTILNEFIEGLEK
ncbi:MAG: hypothetical protein IJU91_06655 [Selenomonadaceae bacterium]|nr:hypothetical protein [Selenomonadaceae bacterium]